ncbi:sensor histidine kinase [Azohydromonas aeria]|uniref:sensor histidine kinase n=1 Tax=Azohydromonas aeria TaxID=2590212 RepID=UPI0012F9945C|nr:sensor histidine kinase [Azohydromonas aeria]
MARRWLPWGGDSSGQRPRRGRSFRRTLLAVLLPGLLAVVAGEVWLTWRTAVDAADAAYDRSLLGAIKSIDANISTESGGLSIELPYRMLEFFELTASGPVQYRVATEDDLVEIGNADLPRPAEALVTGQPYFADAEYFGIPVRVASYARMLDRPLGGQAVAQRVVIQVAEPLTLRSHFTRRLVAQALTRDLVLVSAAGLLLVVGVSWTLRPLGRLRSEVLSRSPQDLRPIALRDVPTDVQPLIDAINHHVERNRALVEARRRFVDDASHQLRTPLATLTTQLAYALREPDPERLRDALAALKVQLDETVRQTNQMLMLARADSAELRLEPLDLVDFAAGVTRAWWPQARDQGIDLGFEAPEGPAGAEEPIVVAAQGGLLKEALSNLLDNAIRYTPGGGHVTVRVSLQPPQARLAVVDDGPGIPRDERGRAGERFFRASNATQSGSGIGLAIVRSIAERHGGRLEIGDGAAGRGLEVALLLPLASHATAAIAG